MAIENTTSLSSAREKFINHLKGQNRSIYTILAYGKDVEQLVTFLAGQKITQVSVVEENHIKAFKEHLVEEKYTPKSISRKLNAIKTFFRFLKKEGVIQVDPSLEITHPKYEVKPPRILSKLEYRALRDTCRADARLSAIVELMLQTGIRIGEISRLELNDVKKNEIKIKADQSQSERTVPLNKAARSALNRYLKVRPKSRTKSVFVTKTGRPLLVRNIRSAVGRFFRLAGIKNATVNDLRNTWIAHHLLLGTNIAFISKMAGHKRISSTQKYLAFVKDSEGKGKKRAEEELEGLEEL